MLLSNKLPTIIWFTGLSGAGKSTLTLALHAALSQYGIDSKILDGDELRRGLCSDLGFSREDRRENVRRVADFADSCLKTVPLVLVACITPFEEDRARLRHRFQEQQYIEVFCNSPLNVCERRDVKGLYQRARRGEIRNFTGIDSIYEEPINPEVMLDTGKDSVEHCIQMLLDYLLSQKMIT